MGYILKFFHGFQIKLSSIIFFKIKDIISGVQRNSDSDVLRVENCAVVNRYGTMRCGTVRCEKLRCSDGQLSTMDTVHPPE